MTDATAAEPQLTYRADGTPLSIQLFTVEGSSYGPYVALPLRDHWTPLAAHLFTRETADRIVADMHRDECGIRGVFNPDTGALTFTLDETFDSNTGAATVAPDEHGRYLIGGLWAWDEWGDHVPHTAGQAAFARGAAEYRGADDSASLSTPLDGLYARGREEAHRVTLRREQPVGTPVNRPYSVTWDIDDVEATSPQEAARIALSLICRDPGPDADTHVFTVHGPDGTKTEVDLDFP